MTISDGNRGGRSDKGVGNDGQARRGRLSEVCEALAAASRRSNRNMLWPRRLAGAAWAVSRDLDAVTNLGHPRWCVFV